jgi:hypothetical protein
MNDELHIDRRAGSHRSNHGIQGFENESNDEAQDRDT